MTTQSPTPTLSERFLARLSDLDAGERGRLKRNAGLALVEARQSLGLFYRLAPPTLNEAELEWYFTVATLFPLTEHAPVGNLGQSMRRARNELNGVGLDRRMEILLDADPEQLRYRLRRAVQMLGAQGIPVNWARLLTDLIYWTHPNHFVQRQWARAYFGAESEATAEPTKLTLA